MERILFDFFSQLLVTEFHIKPFLHIHVDYKSLVQKGVLSFNVVPIQQAVVLDIGVFPVLVVLHELHLGPLYVSLDSELPLLVLTRTTELPIRPTALYHQAKLCLSKRKRGVIPAGKLQDNSIF